MASAPPRPPSPPSLEQITRQTARALIVPYIMNHVAHTSPPPQGGEVIVIVNPRTWSITLIEGSRVDLESLFREKMGPQPASKASIDAMPVVKVDEVVGLECSICLDRLDDGEEVKEMPCEHRYHSACIEKWLRMRGTCPMCRYIMPAEEKSSNKREDEDDGADHEEDGEGEEVEAEAPPEEMMEEGEEEEEEEEEGEEEEDGGSHRARRYVFHVFFSGRRVRRRHSYSAVESDPSWNSNRSGENRNGNSGSSTQGMEMEIDSEPTAQDMDTDEGSS